MKIKIDNWLDARTFPPNLLKRLTDRFGGTFSLDAIGDGTFDLNWEDDSGSWFGYERVVPEIRAYYEGYTDRHTKYLTEP